MICYLIHEEPLYQYCCTHVSFDVILFALQRREPKQFIYLLYSQDSTRIKSDRSVYGCVLDSAAPPAGREDHDRS